jgi:hypothetical protein
LISSSTLEIEIHFPDAGLSVIALLAFRLKASRVSRLSLLLLLAKSSLTPHGLAQHTKERSRLRAAPSM